MRILTRLLTRPLGQDDSILREYPTHILCSVVIGLLVLAVLIIEAPYRLRRLRYTSYAGIALEGSWPTMQGVTLNCCSALSMLMSEVFHVEDWGSSRQLPRKSWPTCAEFPLHYPLGYQRLLFSEAQQDASDSCHSCPFPQAVGHLQGASH